MANKVIVTPFFEKKVKRLVKKFPSLYDELSELENILIENPETGDNLGANIYKVRLASKSKGKGKSGGFRVITFLLKQVGKFFDINLITIYDKSEEASISKEDIVKLVKDIIE